MIASRPMQLYLVRHGAAQDTAPGGDRQRALTAEGRAQLRGVAERLATEKETPQEIWSSPLVRAAQTAEILAAGLRLSAPVETAEELAPGAQAALVLARLSAKPDAARIALVGHEPDLSTLARALTGREGGGLDKGAIWRIDLPAPPAPGTGQLVWKLSPKDVR